MSRDELYAADQEAINEAALSAEQYLDYLFSVDREDALALLREMLRLIAWGHVSAEKIHRLNLSLQEMSRPT